MAARVIRRSAVPDLGILICILALAAGLRLGAPDIVEFKRDEANLSLLALDLANGRSFPLLGIGSSVGLPNAPWNVYLLAVPFLFSSSPVIATQFIGLLNVLAVAFTYVFARRYTGRFAAAWAALLYAVSPWGVLFSRKIWAQDMLPIFFLLTLYAGVLAFLEGRRSAQVAFFPLLAITGQIHYGAFVILPAALWVCWIGRSTWSRMLALGIGIAIVLTLPYAWGVMQALQSAGGVDALVNLSDGLAAGGGTSLSLTADSLRGASIMIAGTQTHSLAGPEMFRDYLATVPNVNGLLMCLPALVGASAVWLMVRAARQRDVRTPVDALLLLWLVFPVAAFSLNWTQFYIHYLIPMLPAVFLVLGFAGHDMLACLRPGSALARVAVSVCLLGGGALGIAQTGLTISLLSYLATHPTPDGFGTPLRYLMPIRAALLETGQAVIGDVGGQTLTYDDAPTVWYALLYDAPSVRFVDALTQVYPLNASMTLSRQCDALPAGQVFWLRPGEGCYHIAPGQTEVEAPDGLEFVTVPPAVPRRFANGAEVLRWRWRSPCLAVVWRIHTETTFDYQFAVHFFDSQGERLYVADGLSWWGRYWQTGDVVLRTFCLPHHDPRIHSAQIGMYTLTSQTVLNVDLLDTNGLPAGQMLTTLFD